MIERQQELQAYAKFWGKDKPKEQVTEELASYSLESKRITDPYSFIVTPDGELLSPSANCLVKNVVRKDTNLGQIEYQALCKVEQWAKQTSEGVIVWISPPYPGEYPVSKIIVSEVEYKGSMKVLFNRAILLDISSGDCIRLANQLSAYAPKQHRLYSSEDVRGQPIPINIKGTHWSHILEAFIGRPEVWMSIRAGMDKKAKKQALETATEVYTELFSSSKVVLDNERFLQIQSTGLLGPYSVSCPPKLGRPTAFAYVFNRALLLNTEHFDCPKCDKKIDSGKGIIVCPHCGARKEDYSRCA